jgi:Glycerol-3-phosphate dehydrogenase
MIRWISTSHQHKKRIQITTGVVSAITAVSVSSFLLSNNRRDSAAVVAAEQSPESSSPSFSTATTNFIHEIPTRSQQIERLSQNQPFDVLVVGGGATGSGIALDAATRGLKVALIERGDFGNETSSRSTKLLWAGIRYIATATASLLRWKNLSRPIEALHDFRSEFKMVQNCHKERRILLENNPHLTNWVPIAVPIDQWISWPPPFGHPIFAMAPMVLPLVFKFYDGMSGFTCPPSHIRVKNEQRGNSHNWQVKMPNIIVAFMKVSILMQELLPILH